MLTFWSQKQRRVNNLLKPIVKNLNIFPYPLSSRNMSYFVAFSTKSSAPWGLADLVLEQERRAVKTFKLWSSQWIALLDSYPLGLLLFSFNQFSVPFLRFDLMSQTNVSSPGRVVQIVLNIMENFPLYIKQRERENGFKTSLRSKFKPLVSQCTNCAVCKSFTFPSTKFVEIMMYYQLYRTDINFAYYIWECL